MKRASPSPTMLIIWHRDEAEAVSLTLPLSDEPYHDTVLFPFFDGLIPEGWLLNIAESSWKINQRDRMSLLLACCKDCIGAVSVIPVPESHAEGQMLHLKTEKGERNMEKCLYCYKPLKPGSDRLPPRLRQKALRHPRKPLSYPMLERKSATWQNR